MRGYPSNAAAGRDRSAARVLTGCGYAVAEASDGERAAGHGSGVRVLLMSGHTAEDLDALDEPLSGARFLPKPWSITDLLHRVRQVLDERLAAAG